MSEKARPTRFLVVLAFAFAAILALVGLSGCGPSAESEIESDIATQLDPIKNVDADTINSWLGDEADSLESVGLDSGEFYASWFSGFDYKIDDIQVNDDTATVAMTITVKQLGTALDDASTELTKNVESGDITDVSQAGPVIIKAMDNTETTDSQITVNYYKNSDGKWTSSDITTEVTNACIGDINY
ncbi:MAG: hypothetical protein ACOYCA_00375 [Eggerthellaceae bacterium]|jgi:hypothetical protein